MKTNVRVASFGDISAALAEVRFAPFGGRVAEAPDSPTLFNLLHLNGKDLRDRTLPERRGELKELLGKRPAFKPL